MTWSNRPTLAPGEYPRGEQLEAVLDQIESLTVPGWTTYTVAWTAVTTPPAIGNGTLTGRYRRAVDSDLVFVEIFMLAGTTTTFGSGEWRFSLPVNASASEVARFAGGSGLIFDNGTQTRSGGSHLVTASTVAPDSASGTCTATVPQTFTTADWVRLELFYEAA